MASSTVGLSMRVVSGLPKLRKFTLDDEGEYLIGRLPASDIQLEHNSVSGEHALLKYDGKRWTLKDLKSHNGTLLNGQKLGTNPEVLPDEGLLRLGGVEVKFHLIASDELTSQLEMSRSGALDSIQGAPSTQEDASPRPPAGDARRADADPRLERSEGTPDSASTSPLSTSAALGSALAAVPFVSLLTPPKAGAPDPAGTARSPAAVPEVALASGATKSASGQSIAPASEMPTLRRSKRRPPSTIVQLTPHADSKPSVTPASPAWTSVVPFSSQPTTAQPIASRSTARHSTVAPAPTTASLPPPIPGVDVESLLGSPPIDDSPPTLTSPHLRARALSARKSSAGDVAARKASAIQEDDNAKALETLPSPKLAEAMRTQTERGSLQVSLSPQPSPGGAPGSPPAEGAARSPAGSGSSPSSFGQTGRTDPLSSSDVARLKHELEQTRRQLNQLLEEKSASRRTLDLLRQEMAQRSQECLALQKSQASAQKELASAMEALNAMRTREDQGMRWLETQRQQRDALQRENEGLKRSLEGARAERGSSSRDQERYLQENSTLRQELARVQAELAFLKQGAMGTTPPTGSAPAPAGEKSLSGSEGSRQELEALKQRNQSLQKALLELRQARGSGTANPTVRALFEEGTSFGERLTTLLESLSRSLEDDANAGERRAILQKASDQVASFMAWLEEGKARKD